MTCLKSECFKHILVFYGAGGGGNQTANTALNVGKHAVFLTDRAHSVTALLIEWLGCNRFNPGYQLKNFEKWPLHVSVLMPKCANKIMPKISKPRSRFVAASNNVELRTPQGQDVKEDELTLCVVDSVGRRSRVSSNAVVGRKPRWDRPTRRGGGEPQRGPGQESGVGYSDRGPEGDPACHQFELSKKAMAGRQGLRSIFRWRCAAGAGQQLQSTDHCRPDTQVNTSDIGHRTHCNASPTIWERSC